MAVNPNPRPAFTPAPCDWLVWQLTQHAGPALDAEIRTLNRYRNKVNEALECTRLTVEQRAELTFILDQLAKRGLIYAGAEDGPTRGEDGRFLGGGDDEQYS